MELPPEEKLLQTGAADHYQPPVQAGPDHANVDGSDIKSALIDYFIREKQYLSIFIYCSYIFEHKTDN